MKWLFALLLALVVFGGAALFSYYLFFKQEIAVRHEQRGDVTPAPTPDISLPEFQAAAKLRQEDKLTEARDALSAFIQKYPTDLHAEEAKDLLGEVNIDILLNNMSGTMLHIGDRLLISHPEFSIVIQRKAKLVVLLNRGAFFKQYHVREEKLSPKQPARVTTKVAETMAWRDGKRVGFGTKEFLGSTRWIRLGAAAYTLYSVADSAHPEVTQPPPPQGLGLDATDLEELSGLVNSRTPVTITD
ncbi:MAG: hypothetical protein DMF30_08260 [Verrucomicrobia bacterium]|nr:MAG: hypothetical protein DMF30_08260 [Verrucomicrobiota bacterium]